jgi:Uma2 family endonuclease
MTEAERHQVVDTLPSEFTLPDALPPEGDDHYRTTSESRDTLFQWFTRRKHRVYVSGNMAVYFPGQRVFAPDVIAVRDVDPHPRSSWIVSAEGGRGLDFALEVIVSGERRKDLRDNVTRYAALGIQEYFVFDFTRATLHAYFLGDNATYQRALPQGGLFTSHVLELQLSVEKRRLRFSIDGAPILAPLEMVSKLSSLVDDATSRALELESALEEEQRRREEEQRRREEVEAENVRLRAELAELRSRNNE